MKCNIFFTHRSYRCFVHEKTFEVGIDIRSPILSRFNKSIQSRCVQRRSPLIFLPASSSFSMHGPHSPKHFEHVLLVYASGVGTNRKLLDSFRIKPTPTHRGLPLLHATPAFPAIKPRDPYAKTSCRLSVFKHSTFL